MSDTVIKVCNLSKKYLIQHQQRGRYTALRDVMANSVKRVGRKLFSSFTIHDSHFTASKEEFFALKDVNFEIKRGDRVGIIGRNGAGKSTLLKVLSRITEPTTGRIEITGRVASLLEVGTGFHPELTGRENIFLNGAILGMPKAEIKEKFDAIVDFAEIEKFLDTPVKRYSSGMYVRLAFAVAAHLEPEILIVDEVLAVGDAQFQKKCLGKMEEVGKEGRTVLFVSHNLQAISRLCSRAVYLVEGRVENDGPIENAIADYLNDHGNIYNILRINNIEAEVSFLDGFGKQISAWEYSKVLFVKVQLTSRNALFRPAVDVSFYAESGAKAFSLKSDLLEGGQVSDSYNNIVFIFSIINPGFAVSSLSVDVGVREGGHAEYLACWRGVNNVPISVRMLQNLHVADALVAPEAEVKIEL
ncbi:MAG: ABC transporter ATP-binding protein [Nitrospirae bacterium]|nr:ABC transporter ATP-binding protein [Nitrospirota bacterium]